MAQPAQVRAWTRRLGISGDQLRAVIDKVGDSAVAVTKEVDRQAGHAGHHSVIVPEHPCVTVTNLSAR